MAVKNLAGKRVLITGAASGVGRACALLVGSAGGVLYLTDIAADGLADVAAEVTAVGGTVALAEAFDISDYDAVTVFGARVHAEVDAVDVVMNVAGISAWGTVEHLAHEHWRALVEVNLMGPIHVIETFIPPMVAAGRGGHLVNVSSAAGLLALPWHAAYSATKFGLRGMSEVLRFDLEHHGIGVSLAAPGGVRTPLVKSVHIAGVDREDPRVVALEERFDKRAVTADVAARAILDGMARNKFLIFTSRDVQVGYWFKRKFALPYETVMRLANKRFAALLPPPR